MRSVGSRLLGSLEKPAGSLHYPEKMDGKQVGVLTRRRLSGKFFGRIGIGIAIIKLVHQAGAREIRVATAHGTTCGNAIEHIQNELIPCLIVTTGVPLEKEQLISKVKVFSAAPLLAEAIKRIHHDQPITVMFRPWPLLR